MADDEGSELSWIEGDHVRIEYGKMGMVSERLTSIRKATSRPLTTLFRPFRIIWNLSGPLDSELMDARR